MEVPVPTPPQLLSDYAKESFSIEVAFNALLQSGHQVGLTLEPVMGLMYLPDPEATRSFQQACHKVFECLKPRP